MKATQLPNGRYEELWSRYEQNCRSLTLAEMDEMNALSPYRWQGMSFVDGNDECPECGRREHSCCCGYFAALEMELG